MLSNGIPLHIASFQKSPKPGRRTLDSYQKILNFIRSTRTETGLSVTAQLDRRNYPTGTEPTPEQLQSPRLKPYEILPKWNYAISPDL